MDLFIVILKRSHLLSNQGPKRNVEKFTNVCMIDRNLFLVHQVTVSDVRNSFVKEKVIPRLFLMLKAQD